MAITNTLIYIPPVLNILEEILKSLSLSFLVLFSSIVLADSSYYPKEIQDQIKNKTIRNDELKAALNTVLTSSHKKDNNGSADTLGCDETAPNCYAHINLGYDGARRVMFGKIYLKQDPKGYFVEDVYCQKKFYSSDKVGPNAIPNHDKINCEHTWPQSKFSGKYPKEIQKADLHHLYPTDSTANSIRGNFNFSDIASDNGKLADDDCTSSKSGSSVASGGDDYFEPPTIHKGNVARSLFYFSVRYSITIPKAEEAVLRKWNELDPIDQDEINKNEIIYSVQKNRNPFIDYPELINAINKF